MIKDAIKISFSFLRLGIRVKFSNKENAALQHLRPWYLFDHLKVETFMKGRVKYMQVQDKL